MSAIKFPSWEEAISGITDSRFIELPDKQHVRAGARIMYDRLYGMLSCKHGGSTYTRWIDGKEIWHCIYCDEPI